MIDHAQRRLQAQTRYGNAQLAEKNAREGHDQVGVDVAKAEQEAALNEIYEVDEEVRTNAGEEKVTLISPNPQVTITDANGLEFVDGRAKGVRRSIAARYVADLDGYTIEGETKK